LDGNQHWRWHNPIAEQLSKSGYNHEVATFPSASAIAVLALVLFHWLPPNRSLMQDFICAYLYVLETSSCHIERECRSSPSSVARVRQPWQLNQSPSSLDSRPFAWSEWGKTSQKCNGNTIKQHWFETTVKYTRTITGIRTGIGSLSSLELFTATLHRKIGRAFVYEASQILLNMA
jgi:hypothetical protein